MTASDPLTDATLLQLARSMGGPMTVEQKRELRRFVLEVALSYTLQLVEQKLPVEEKILQFSQTKARSRRPSHRLVDEFAAKEANLLGALLETGQALNKWGNVCFDRFFADADPQAPGADLLAERAKLCGQEVKVALAKLKPAPDAEMIMQQMGRFIEKLLINHMIGSGISGASTQAAAQRGR